MTSSRSIAQTDKISLQLNTWFTLHGSQPVHVNLISFFYTFLEFPMWSNYYFLIAGRGGGGGGILFAIIHSKEILTLFIAYPL